jgi:hypothetical protein
MDHVCWIRHGDRVSDTAFDDALRTFLPGGWTATTGSCAWPSTTTAS